ncbi:hypothetical protein [[Scytonema hofmanni] UTEX B 1581]|uniref:hypothetical protein n=1 Tax=[Scytonema hofmanni] UTEX B 1581 TaxID=379535 RepID=UPI001183B7B5|nr:hypothetical protein [[Scytonema hofmanni] UTEX B 1581]
MLPFWNNQAIKRNSLVNRSFTLSRNSQYLLSAAHFWAGRGQRYNPTPELFVLPIFEEIECQNKL